MQVSNPGPGTLPPPISHVAPHCVFNAANLSIASISIIWFPGALLYILRIPAARVAQFSPLALIPQQSFCGEGEGEGEGIDTGGGGGGEGEDGGMHF